MKYQVIEFKVPNDDDEPFVHYLSINDKSDDKSYVKIPLYRKEKNERKYYLVENIFFPSCTKFMHYMEFLDNEMMTEEEIKKKYGEIPSPLAKAQLPGQYFS